MLQELEILRITPTSIADCGFLCETASPPYPESSPLGPRHTSRAVGSDNRLGRDACLR